MLLSILEVTIVTSHGNTNWSRRIYAWARAKHFGCHSVCVIMGSHFQVMKLENRVFYSH